MEAVEITSNKSQNNEEFEKMCTGEKLLDNKEAEKNTPIEMRDSQYEAAEKQQKTGSEKKSQHEIKAVFAPKQHCAHRRSLKEDIRYIIEDLESLDFDQEHASSDEEEPKEQDLKAAQEEAKAVEKNEDDGSKTKISPEVEEKIRAIAYKIVRHRPYYYEDDPEIGDIDGWMREAKMNFERGGLEYSLTGDDCY